MVSITKKFTFNMSEEAYELLREKSYKERRSMTNILVEVLEELKKEKKITGYKIDPIAEKGREGLVKERGELSGEDYA